MEFVADRRLGKLEEQSIRVTHDNAMDNITTTEFCLQEVTTHGIRAPRNLHNGVERSDAIKERGDANDAFVADDTHLDRLAVRGLCETRNHCFLRKVNLFDPLTSLVENGVLREDTRLQVRGKQATLPFGQFCQNMIAIAVHNRRVQSAR